MMKESTQDETTKDELRSTWILVSCSKKDISRAFLTVFLIFMGSVRNTVVHVPIPGRR